MSVRLTSIVGSTGLCSFLQEEDAARRAAEKEREEVNIRQSTLVKGAVIAPFQPDIGRNRNLERGTPLLERVDYKGEKKRREVQVRGVLLRRVCMCVCVCVCVCCLRRARVCLEILRG